MRRRGAGSSTWCLSTTYLPTSMSVCLFIHSVIHSLIHSFILSFIPSFIFIDLSCQHALTQPTFVYLNTNIKRDLTESPTALRAEFARRLFFTEEQQLQVGPSAPMCVDGCVWAGNGVKCSTAWKGVGGRDKRAHTHTHTHDD